MKEFLSDYGLHWIGEKPLSKARSCRSEWVPKEAEPPTAGNGGTGPGSAGEFCPDYDLVARNVEELNELVEGEEPRIVSQANGATFATNRPRSVPLTLFANGLALYQGPFRSFQEDPLARKFCIDIMDGYFPSELQTAFPDGVAFRLVDKRHVHFQPASLNSVFHSKGYRLGSAAGSARASSESRTMSQPPGSTPTSTRNVETQLSGTYYFCPRPQTPFNSCPFSLLFDSPDTAMSMEQFLSKLPSSVVKNGNLIPVRQDLSNLLTQPDQPSRAQQEPQQNAIVDSPALQFLKARFVPRLPPLPKPTLPTRLTNSTNFRHPELTSAEELFGAASQEPEIATLRIKVVSSEEASSSYLIRMFYSDTIGHLKQHIEAHR